MDDGSPGEEPPCLAFLAGAESQAALGILQTWHVSSRRSFGILAVLEMPAHGGVRVGVGMAVMVYVHMAVMVYVQPPINPSRHCTATGGSSTEQSVCGFSHTPSSSSGV